MEDGLGRYKIVIENNSYCQYCGVLEPFTPIYVENGCTVCCGCAISMSYIDYETYVNACKESIPKKIKYFQERIKFLNNMEITHPIWKDLINN